MSEWNKVKGKDQDSVIHEISKIIKAPDGCNGCLWIKVEDGKEVCYYEGDEYENFSDEISEEGINLCHSKIAGIEEVDWFEYD